MDTPTADIAKFSENDAKDITTSILLILTGAATGMFSGFFGGGGGMLIVPALSVVMKISEKQAHATAIAVILPVTAVCAVVYGIRGVSLGAQFPLILGGVIAGGAFGAALMNKISNGFLALIFYGLMIAAGIKILL